MGDLLLVYWFALFDKFMKRSLKQILADKIFYAEAPSFKISKKYSLASCQAKKELG